MRRGSSARVWSELGFRAFGSCGLEKLEKLDKCRSGLLSAEELKMSMNALFGDMGDEDAGIDFSRVVHGDQRFSYTRPVVAGDELRATMTVTSVKSLGGNSMVTASSEIVDAEGAHVVTVGLSRPVDDGVTDGGEPRAERGADAPGAEDGEGHGKQVRASGGVSPTRSPS